jgi:hypothetical protein
MYWAWERLRLSKVEREVELQDVKVLVKHKLDVKGEG